MQAIEVPALVRSLSDAVLERLSDVLAGVQAAALVDFPAHFNVGDAAIWLGEKTALSRLGIAVSYACDRHGYDPTHLRKALPEGPILLHGGGNFGDLYPEHQVLRERVLADFPDRHIVQLPQTIAFRDDTSRRETIRRFRRHPQLTLLVRDDRSLEVYGRELAEDVRICPDMAFCLDLQPFESPGGVLWLRREDKERRHWAGSVPPGVRVRDWPELPAAWAARRRFTQVLGLTAAYAGAAGVPLSRTASSQFDRQAQERVRAGTALLASARTIVTDRLHACILALLCDRPVVVLDNTNGKLRAFYETWVWGVRGVTWADEPAEGLDNLFQNILIDARRGVQEAIDCLKDIETNSALAISVVT